MSGRTFIPAAGYDWLLPFYDPFCRLVGAGAAHRRLIEQAHLTRGQRVLEIGCGTGSLTTLVKRLHPDTEVVGLDPDPKALARARRKADRQSVSVELDRGFSDALRYPDASFDRVLSAFMFHHLDRDVKQRTLREVRRVLKPTGSLHLLDFGGEHGGLLAHLFHRSEQFRDNARDAMIRLMREAGFTGAEQVAQRRTIFGRVAYFQASR